MNLGMEDAMLPPGYYLDESDPDTDTAYEGEDS
jgi:hypothetical protein